VAEELHVGAINLDLAGLAHLDVLLAAQRREPPVLAEDDFLAAGELVLRAAQRLDGRGPVRVARPHRQQDLPDVDARHRARRLAVRPAHARLQPVGSGARQHLVDADDVVRVCSHPHVEAFFAGDLHQVLVGADAGRFECFGRELFVFVCVLIVSGAGLKLPLLPRMEVLPRTGDEMDACWEFVDAGLLPAQVENTDLRIGHTTVEARLGIWLVLAVAVAPRRTSRHGAELWRFPAQINVVRWIQTGLITCRTYNVMA